MTDRLRYPAALLLILSIATGCQDIRLISDYDEETEHATTALQRKVESLLIAIERGQSEYENLVDDYGELLVDLRALHLRAVSRPKNDIQAQQFANLEEQLVLLEEAHQEGISPEEIPAFREGFAQSFRAILTLELAKKRGET